ncbi:hypothetical protein ACFU9Y_13420 [Streptomyces sp. NPDC057621]|uniref:hypothetical protein n=1 Tax=Streptomyces sp. NPDC057621 TaxID=3346186 RepID=UPI0036A8D479
MVTKTVHPSSQIAANVPVARSLLSAVGVVATLIVTLSLIPLASVYLPRPLPVVP